MARHDVVRLLVAVLVLTPGVAAADILAVARCQRRFAREGARFAQRVIKAELACSLAGSECQVQCEAGVFGPPCSSNPPPCCDPDDTGSNATFAACMADAAAECDQQDAKIANWEVAKVNNITGACSDLTTEELCGAQSEGLNFATLNAGCLALDPSYTCTLPNLIACVGGPLEREHLDQISWILHPRASDALAALNRASLFPDLPRARKVKEDVPEGKVDVWSFAGTAGDLITVRVKTRDDNGNQTSNLHPLITMLDSDGVTPVPDTNVKITPCSVPTVCGAGCPEFRRHVPFTRTYFLAIRAASNDSCSSGAYRLVVVSPGGQLPVLVADDVDP
jgi:hypothetical protein